MSPSRRDAPQVELKEEILSPPQKRVRANFGVIDVEDDVDENDMPQEAEAHESDMPQEAELEADNPFNREMSLG